MEHDDACLKCTICNQACPVLRVDPDFPGPKALGPEWWRHHLAGDGETLPHVDDCTFCQLCEAACPASVPVAHLIQMHKAARPAPLTHRIRDGALTRLDLLERFPRVASWRTPLDGLLGLSRTTARPRPERPGPEGPRGEGLPIGLFIDCFSRAFDGGVVDSAEALLRVWGFEPYRMPQGPACCGAAAYASGRPGQAAGTAAEAREGVTTVLKTNRSIRTIVTLNGTCDETMRREWADVYGLDPVPVQIVSFTDFALEAAPPSFWEALAAVAGGERAYVHTTCRNRADRGDGVLDEVCRRAGLHPVWTGLTCCGASGSYAFKAEHAEVAHRMVDSLGALPDEGAIGLMTDSGTCALHLAAETGLRARHPAYFLHELWQRAFRKATTLRSGGRHGDD